MQQHLGFIPHQIEEQIIFQRKNDGYINASALCNASGKSFNQYRELQTTKKFLEALEKSNGIKKEQLIQTHLGTSASERGIWVHPQVAIALAQWLSPEFQVRVTKWVTDWLSGAIKSPTRLPYHLHRYVVNAPNVPRGHFSILTEMAQLLLAPMEREGYELPEKLLPDISQGRMFCKWLRDEKGINTDNLPTYRHVFDDGRVVFPKAYPEELLAEFRRHFREEWLSNKAVEYFRGRDAEALQYIPKLLSPPSKVA
jgi:hypothetical protein